MGKRHFGLPFLQKLDKLAFQNAHIGRCSSSQNGNFDDLFGFFSDLSDLSG